MDGETYQKLIKQGKEELDIDLNVCNGINIAKYLRQLHPQLIIIFVSRREELVFQTFSTGVCISSYLLTCFFVYSTINSIILSNSTPLILISNNAPVNA